MHLTTAMRAALVGLWLAGSPLLAQAQQATAPDDEATLSTLRAEREAAEARDNARLAELVDDEAALDEALAEAQDALADARERRESLDAREQSQREALEELDARRQEQGAICRGCSMRWPASAASCGTISPPAG